MGDAETGREIGEVRAVLAYTLQQVTKIEVMVEGIATVLATILDDAKPDDPHIAEEWLGRLRDVAIANVEMRAATLRLNAMAEGRTAPDDVAAAEEHKQALVEMLETFFHSIARPTGEVP